MSHPRVFVSYVSEDQEIVDRLVSDLRARYVDVWYAGDVLRPGVFWREEIRRAILGHDFFIACFSDAYAGKSRTYMNEELEIALQEIRLRGSAPWFIPVLLSGSIPDREIGAGRTLRDIQFVQLSEPRWHEGFQELMLALQPTTERARPVRLPGPTAASFQGEGSGATESFQLENGLWFAAIAYRGSDHLVVWLVDQEGKRIAQLADVATGSTFSAVNDRTYVSTLFPIQSTSCFRVDVRAKASWLFRINRPVRVAARARLYGDLPLATYFYSLESGDYTFRVSYKGSAEISVILYSAGDERAHLLVDKARAAELSTTVPLLAGDYAFAIHAFGTWEITWGKV